MASLTQLKNNADALLAEWWPAFTTWQENYKNDPVRSPDARYWQGLLWPASIPDDGVAVVPPNSETDNYPSYQTYPLPWRTVVQEVIAGIVNPSPYWDKVRDDLAINTPPNLVVSVRVDQYLTPSDGVGYVMFIEFTKNGVVWTKAVGVGPETAEHAHDWRDDTPGTPP